MVSFNLEVLYSIIFLKRGRNLFYAKEWTIIPESAMALSPESLKLRCSSLLPAWQAVQEQGFNGHCLELHPLIINSNSWQVLMYSHAGLGIRRRQRAAPLNSIVYFALWGRLLKKIAGSSVSMLVFLWGCFNRVALEWKSHPEKWVRHLLILPGLKCIALKLESLKLITPSSCQVQLKSKFLNAFFPLTLIFFLGWTYSMLFARHWTETQVSGEFLRVAGPG